MFWGDFTELSDGGDHVFTELDHYCMAPAAVVEIRLAIVINEGMGVDWLSSVVVLRDERFAQGVFEWARWRIADRDADSGSVSCRKVEVIVPIFNCNRWCPRSPVGAPWYVFEVENAAFISPVSQVVACPNFEEGLVFVGGREGWVDVVSTLEVVKFGVRIPTRENRIRGEMHESNCDGFLGNSGIQEFRNSVLKSDLLRS